MQIHGFLNRMSDDVGLFTTARTEFDFAHAVYAVIAAYQHERIQVDTEMRNASFARLNVASGEESAKVE